MDNFSELEHLILDNIYIDKIKLTDLIQSGRLMSVGFCKECEYHLPPLTGVIDGEVKELTSMRCPLMSSGFTQPNGWCYHFRQNGNNLFTNKEGCLLN